MTSSLARVLTAVCVVVLAACAGETADQAGPTTAATSAPTAPTATGAPTPTSGATTDPGTGPAADGSTFTGTLEGDAQLEGGCLWLASDGDRYELQLPPSYEVDLAELAIVAPSGETITAGTELQVVGELQEDMVTICQVGPVIDVASITPAG